MPFTISHIAAVLPAHRTLRRCCVTACPWDWRVWLGAAATVLAGALTHLVWDGFTHEDGRGVRMLPFPDDYGPDIEGHPFRLYRWLQHVSSVVGLLVVLLAAWRWTRADRRERQPGASAHGTWLFPELGEWERRAWLAAYLLIPAAMLVLTAAPGLVHARLWDSFRDLVSRLAFVGLGGAIVSLALVSGLVRLRLALLPRRLDA